MLLFILPCPIVGFVVKRNIFLTIIMVLPFIIRSIHLIRLAEALFIIETVYDNYILKVKLFPNTDLYFVGL